MCMYMFVFVWACVHVHPCGICVRACVCACVSVCVRASVMMMFYGHFCAQSRLNGPSDFQM